MDITRFIIGRDPIDPDNYNRLFIIDMYDDLKAEVFRRHIDDQEDLLRLKLQFHHYITFEFDDESILIGLITYKGDSNKVSNYLSLMADWYKQILLFDEDSY